MARRRSLLITLTFLLLAPLFSAGNGTTAQSPGIYIALGDSIAAGVGSSLPRVRSYPAVVHQWMEDHADATVPFSNLAVPGETAASFMEDGQLEQFRSEVARAREGQIPIHAVTLSLGGNEILAVSDAGLEDREEALASFRTNLEQAVEAIRQEIGPDVPLVLTTYYDLTAGDASIMFTDSWWIEQFNTAIREVAAGSDAVVAGVQQTFEGRIDELTYYPDDVHPTNQGYLAIAQQVWQALEFDTEAPVIDGVSPEAATRRTPTLHFQVDDNVGVASITVQVDGQEPVDPLQVAETEYILLLDLRNVQAATVTVQIEARDQAGNQTTIDHSLQLNGIEG